MPKIFSIIIYSPPVVGVGVNLSFDHANFPFVSTSADIVLPSASFTYVVIVVPSAVSITEPACVLFIFFFIYAPIDAAVFTPVSFVTYFPL